MGSIFGEDWKIALRRQSYFIGDSTEVIELEENNLYKSDPFMDDEHLDIDKIRLSLILILVLRW
jgi:hypothetical protein